MAAIPWMALYPSDYLADTAHLTRAQSGSYMFLLMNYWQTGKPLDNTDDRLAVVARMTPEEWQSEKAILGEFFQIKRNKWTHKRVEVEIQKVLVKSVKNSENGKKSAVLRSTFVKRSLNERSTNAERSLNHTDTDTHTDKRKELVQISFERFWDVYPRKQGKAKAKIAFDKSVKTTDAELIIEAALKYAKDPNRVDEFTAMPATWLTGERWNDAPLPQKSFKNGGVSAITSAPTPTPPRFVATEVQSGVQMPENLRRIALGRSI